MQGRIIAFIILLSAFIYGCKSSLYVPQNAAVTTLNDSTLQELKLGRKLYIMKCSGCHNLHLPEEYNSMEWVDNLDGMQNKAKITSEEKNLILKYLLH